MTFFKKTMSENPIETQNNADSTKNISNENNVKSESNISNNEIKTTEINPPPSKPAKPDLSLFIQRNKTNELIERFPGQINGNQFVGNQLNQCKVIVRDFCDSVFIDKSNDSDFILCSVRGSIFVRDCTNCRFVMVCGQFRCRNCSNCQFFMHVKTGPVVESSENLTIGCAQIYYPELQAQMIKAKLFPAINIWNDVHDFTPGPGHFSLADNVKITSEEMDILAPYEQKTDNYLLPFIQCPNYQLKHWSVKVSEDKINEIAKISQNIKITKIEHDQGNNLIIIVELESKEEVETAFQGLFSEITSFYA